MQKNTCNVLTPSVFVGFGAKLTPEETAPVMHEFFVTLDPNNPFCAGVPGLLDAYRRYAFTFL